MTRDVTTFITLMDAHGRAGHIEQMEIYHRAMLAAGHKPSLKVYNALLSAYGKAQDIEQMTYYVNVWLLFCRKGDCCVRDRPRFLAPLFLHSHFAWLRSTFEPNQWSFACRTLSLLKPLAVLLPHHRLS